MYVAKPRGQVPSKFVAAARDEMKLVLAALKGANGKAFSYDFRAYKHPDLKAVLERLFDGRCAYCEANYGITGNMEVEHYRPKSVYYWLAAEWSNLLPSCNLCNNGKRSKFPLRDQRKQARRKGGEKREDPLLLDPSDPRPTRRPERHLSFNTADGAIQVVPIRGVASPVGAKSIEIYRLTRKKLSEARRDWAARVRNQLMFTEAARQGRLTAAQRKAADDGLMDLLRPGQPFRSLTVRILRDAGFSTTGAKRRTSRT